MKKSLSQSVAWTVCAAALGAALSGCASSDDHLAQFLVAPDKYVLYNCDDIAAETVKTAAREQELQQLIARASTDPGGRIISAMTYETDYATARAELAQLRAAAVSKRCNPPGTVPATAGSAPAR
jgi:hypothetical protein